MQNQSVYEVISQAYENNPKLKLATNDHENCIGAWSNSLNRYVMVASLTLTGQWVSMPFELLVNGKPPVENWKAVTDVQIVKAVL